jgi:hypothetical protein
VVCFRNTIVNNLHKCDNNNNNNNNNNIACRGGDLEVESISAIDAAQNQVLKTKYNTTKI